VARLATRLLRRNGRMQAVIGIGRADVKRATLAARLLRDASGDG